MLLAIVPPILKKQSEIGENPKVRFAASAQE